MEIAATVSFRERRRDTLEYMADAAERRYAPVAPCVELVPVDQVHDDVEVALVQIGPSLEPVNADDVRMIELQEDPAFAANPRLMALALLVAEIGCPKERQLQRVIPSVAADLVGDAEPALAEQIDDLPRPHHRAGEQVLRINLLLGVHASHKPRLSSWTWRLPFFSRRPTVNCWPRSWSGVLKATTTRPVAFGSIAEGSIAADATCTSCACPEPCNFTSAPSN